MAIGSDKGNLILNIYVNENKVNEPNTKFEHENKHRLLEILKRCLFHMYNLVDTTEDVYKSVIHDTQSFIECEANDVQYDI